MYSNSVLVKSMSVVASSSVTPKSEKWALKFPSVRLRSSREGPSNGVTYPSRSDTPGSSHRFGQVRPILNLIATPGS